MRSSSSLKQRQRDSLRQILSDEGVKRPQVVATILIDQFAYGKSTINKNNLIKKRLISDRPKAFSEWRKEISKLGWFEYGFDNVRGIRYQAKEKLKHYIEPLINESLSASQEYVENRIDDKIKALRKELMAAIESKIEEIDPPATEEKITHYLKLC